MNKDRSDLENLQKLLSKCYTKELCYPKISSCWDENNKCLGMCAITALVVNDCMGGYLGKIYVDNISHYFNVIDDEIIDLTANQFAHPIDYFNYEIIERETILSNEDTFNRYENLKKRMLNQNMKHEKSCGTIIFDQDTILLIGAKDDEGNLFWSFPKGHQEDGETDIETAIRETSEEVGLDVEIINQVPIIVSHLICNGTGIKDIYLFLAKPKNGKIKPQENEVELWRWVKLDNIDKYLVDYYKEAWDKAQRLLRLE